MKPEKKQWDWLQYLPCSCRVMQYKDNKAYGIDYCPMHKAAPELSEALENCVHELKLHTTKGDLAGTMGRIIQQGEKALANAKRTK
jgi:hypothetical protein